MTIATLQPAFSSVRSRIARLPVPNPVEKTFGQRVAKINCGKPELFGKVSEVTIIAVFLVMLAPLGAVAYAAGLSSICMAAGAIAGLFGAAVFGMEQRAVTRYKHGSDACGGIRPNPAGALTLWPNSPEFG